MMPPTNSARVALHAALLLSCLYLQPADAAEPLLSNGDFTVDADGNGVPDGWSSGDGISWETDATRFLRLRVVTPGVTVSAYRMVALPPVPAVEFSCRIRTIDVRRGAEPWHDARIILHCLDGAGKELPADIQTPAYSGSTAGWRDCRVRFNVPSGTAKLTIMPALFQAAGGTFDLAALSVQAVAAEAQRKDAEPQIQGGKPLPAELHVDGARVLTAAGAEVWLQGVNVPSLEWSATGDDVIRNAIAAVDDWKANVVRLPVHDDWWAGRGKGQSDGGRAYRALVDQVITAVTTRSAWVILDLHRFHAPSQQDLAFWSSAAQVYRANPGVLFGLFNEPHGLSWQLWRDGGMVAEKRAAGDKVLAENKEATTKVDSPGMVRMLAAVRATGARNLAIIGGLDWSYDLSGILQGFAIEDTSGNGIVYDSHVYPWKSDWQGKLLAVAERHPVVLGEVGCDIERFDFVPPERFEDPYTWAPDMLACIQKHHLHWTAWSLHPGAKPALLQADFRTPTPYWGAFVRAALRGAHFTSERLR